MPERRWYNGRSVTANGFTVALDFSGKPLTFLTADGKREPVMMGVTEFGVPGQEELLTGESGGKTRKTGARFVIWLPDARGRGRGVTVDGAYYMRVQAEPEKHKAEADKLREVGCPLDICCA